MNNWSVWINVKWNQETPKQDWSWLNDWKEVKGAWSTMGNWDMTLWVELGSPTEVETFVHNKLRAQKWVADTETHWVKEVWNAA